ncbi:mitochondrial genome maintenance protein mgm101 [Verticillium alfalfae VaMs.102]|uniref:Mitochondrial genome maintenance protein MGM101 n=1 Tax=Verticillium alfalfae (strain VaMs.102 / ATCC MYA-4576 / FGSC 10136) TaxID=526221 RepID=C9SWC5_VERA1|nr:mitochondrial genome maintenance protein mgm101 [Verticillium alfalfae VaMs.102]EEY23090.1 mitochondrial genome maintenance protein mgm101 [Verticillium alfalfae VaMs.102]
MASRSLARPLLRAAKRTQAARFSTSPSLLAASPSPARYVSQAAKPAPARSAAAAAKTPTSPAAPTSTAPATQTASPAPAPTSAHPPPPPPSSIPTIDWSTSYHGLSTTAFTPEVAAHLTTPISPADIEVKPDGIIYLPEIKYRRILNAALGPAGWGLVPRGPPVVADRTVTREYALVAQGRFIAQAQGENQFFAAEALPAAVEGCKSNALMRCCKGHWRRVRAVGSRLHPRLPEAACRAGLGRACRDEEEEAALGEEGVERRAPVQEELKDGLPLGAGMPVGVMELGREGREM